MHNAAISLELLGSTFPKGSAQPSDVPWLVTSALRGLAQATRSLQLLAAGSGVAPPPIGESMQPSLADVVAALDTASRRRDIEFAQQLGEYREEPNALDVDRLAEILAAGIEVIERAGTAAQVCLRSSDESQAQLVFEVRPQDGPATIVDADKSSDASR